jgi:hypothetical protein
VTWSVITSCATVTERNAVRRLLDLHGAHPASVIRCSSRAGRERTGHSPLLSAMILHTTEF